MPVTHPQESHHGNSNPKVRLPVREIEIIRATVHRFGRMQDTVGDKLIPALLRSMAETTGSVLDNLNPALAGD